MTSPNEMRVHAREIGLARFIAGILAVGVLLYAYVLGGEANGLNPFNYFGFFTNLTSLLTAALLIATGLHPLLGRPVPAWLVAARAVATACMLIVAVVYNVLVPGTGTAPPLVSAALHIVLPAVVFLDWLLVGDRPPLPWPRVWLVIPYPALWLAVVLVRGATDGWVPYGFLLPERGLASLGLHVIGLFAALSAAGALVWAVSRCRGLTNW
ncbi:Pr6Pr family membrane protein [Glycomyces luteolus]|uniref:Pr6Pr family membrane protein n=1 Tax=Glycomyces luteolus TaxID=2670330 RepID=A0A9X3PBK7_9ACTN|nr:Pr6Pr family membrane protein [Glycomyces luteolus]MDA1359569.1 Pr6Pr family membrane protein [Glycomyces luteolus]